jgi:hypothetical protein
MTNEPNEAVQQLLGRLRTGDWLDAQHFPPLEYAVPGLVPAGFGLFVGPPKVGKSWAVLSVALSLASGSPAFGRVPVGVPRPVLYLALEDGDRRLQERARLLMGGAAIPALFTYETQLTPLQSVPLIRAWMDLHRNSRPLVVVDTLGKVAPPAQVGESAYARDYRVGGTLKRLADDIEGATVLVVHHDRKAATDDFVDSVSGTNGLAGSADFVIVLDRKRQETNGVLKVTGRDVAEAEYGVTIDGQGRWTLLGDSLTTAAAEASTVRSTAGLGGKSASIVRYVNDHQDGVKAADVALALSIPTDQTTVYLGRLATGGKIAKVARGLYGPVESVRSVGLSVGTGLSNPTTPPLPVGSVVTTQVEPTLPTQQTGERWGTPVVEPTDPTHATDPTACTSCHHPLRTQVQLAMGLCRLHLTGEARTQDAVERGRLKRAS